MRIRRVRLSAGEAAWEALIHFYAKRLGLPSVTMDVDRYGFTTGGTLIEFKPADREQPFYHFALRVPRNRFEAARAWLGSHAELLTEPDSGETRFDFANWRAEACYAHDPCGNIVELIAHHELPEETIGAGPFSSSELLGVCEVGLVGPDTRAMATALEPLGIGLLGRDVRPSQATRLHGRTRGHVDPRADGPRLASNRAAGRAARRGRSRRRGCTRRQGHASRNRSRGAHDFARSLSAARRVTLL
jgi:hypothetical protein